MGRLRHAVTRTEVLLVNPPDELPLSRFTRDAGRMRAGIELGREVGRGLAQRLASALPRAEPSVAELAQPVHDGAGEVLEHS
jgi:hypothetical protein